MTDIVVFTKGRLEYLKQTLGYIVKRTRSPYRLYVIDDGSSERDGNALYLIKLWRKGVLEGLFLRHTKGGLRSNLNVGVWMTFSDPFVIAPDDVLCPSVNPDWLSRGLKVLAGQKDIGILGLNSPAGNRLREEGARKAIKVVGSVTFCNAFPMGHISLIRRAVVQDWAWPHSDGQRVRAGRFPATQLAAHCAKAGLKLAYLTDTYCQHIGYDCAREDKSVEKNILTDVDPETLKPNDAKWAW